MNTKGTLSIMQIMILIVGIIAISWAVGSGVGVVSAVEIGGACTQAQMQNGAIAYHCVGDLIEKIGCHSGASGEYIWKVETEDGVEIGPVECSSGQTCVDGGCVTPKPETCVLQLGGNSYTKKPGQWICMGGNNIAYINDSCATKNFQPCGGPEKCTEGQAGDINDICIAPKADELDNNIIYDEKDKPCYVTNKGSCTMPYDSSAGDSCFVNDDPSIPGNVLYNLCMSDLNLKKKRCCVPTGETAQPPTGANSCQGKCLPVRLSMYGMQPCVSDDKHKCIIPNEIDNKPCGNNGHFEYGYCNYPDMDGNGMTDVCCVPNKSPGKSGTECIAGKNGEDESGTCQTPTKSKCYNGNCVQCTEDIHCQQSGTKEKYKCNDKNVCQPPGAGDTPYNPSNYLNGLTFGLFGSLVDDSSTTDKGAKEDLTDWVKKDGNAGKYFKSMLGAGATWAGISGTAAALILPAAGAGAGGTTAITAASALAFQAGFAAKGAIGAFGGMGAGWGLLAGGIGLGIGAGAFMLLYHEEAKREKTFDSNPWEAMYGGDHCEECNDELFGCTEYQCKSLGQACEIINAGTDEELCVHMDRHDTNPPEIIPWEAALLVEGDYKYQEDTAISPPDNGVYIVYEGEETTSEGFDNTISCIPAYTPFSFGVTVLNGPAHCKIDTDLKQNFSDMTFDFGGSSTAKYNHSQVMSLPGPNATANQDIILENGGDFDLYVRCIDHNGIEAVGSFAFKFCVNDGPDTTAPRIMNTDPLSGFPFAFNVSAIDVNLYVNEPAVCRWSHLDETFEDMEINNVDQNCDTGNDFSNVNSQMLYPCPVELDGLNDGVENTFYFRCQDTSENTNIESYVYALEGSQPLAITEVSPNETLKGSTNSIQIDLMVKTFAGFNEGKSNCYYSETGNEEDYTLFLDDGLHENFMHLQKLWKEEGEYKYYIKCVDLAGNSDYSDTTFTVDTDTDAPIVVRVYHEEAFLKVITDEKSDCVYSSDDCTYEFEDGLPMEQNNEINHFTDWETNTNYYVKCKDDYGNMPAPDKCSVKVRPFETYFEEIL